MATASHENMFIFPDLIVRFPNAVLVLEIFGSLWIRVLLKEKKKDRLAEFIETWNDKDF